MTKPLTKEELDELENVTYYPIECYGENSLLIRLLKQSRRALELEPLRARVEELARDLEREREAVLARAESDDDRIASLEAELSFANDSLEAARRNGVTLSEAKRKAESELATLREENAELKDTLHITYR